MKSSVVRSSIELAETLPSEAVSLLIHLGFATEPVRFSTFLLLWVQHEAWPQQLQAVPEGIILSPFGCQVFRAIVGGVVVHG